MPRRNLVTLLISSLCALLLTTTLSAGGPRTGEIKDNKYTDTRFGFSVQLPEDWKIGKPKKEMSSLRLIAQQKNPAVPIKLRSDPDWALRPTILILCDSTDMTPREFFDFLRSDSGDSEFKDEVLLRSVLLHRLSSYRLDLLTETIEDIAGAKALELTGRLQYDAQVELPGRSRIELVRGFRIGHIYLVPFDGWLMYIEQACENEFLQNLDEVFAGVVHSITFGDSSETQMNEGEE